MLFMDAWIRRRSPGMTFTLLVAGLTTVAGVGCDTEDDATTYRATIRRTSFGIPHIKADDYGSLGFGMGYAFAEDRPCMLLDQVIKVRGERARYLGPGDGDEHITSDFAYRHLGLTELAREAFEERPQQVQDMVRGYAAGFNRYVAEAGADNLPGHCQGADWVVPVDEYDLMAYYLDLGLNASSKQLIDSIGTATPPGTGDAQGTPVTQIGDWRDHIGSNGWGIGKDRSANGRGMLLANPHFPWEGELRLWESHLTIPGEMDVYGAGLSGVPIPLIGFNEGMAWTHTVSAGQRLTLYTIELGSSPTTYVFDGEEQEMESGNYTIEVLRDGELVEESRTLYRTMHGPIVNISPFGWDGGQTLALRDANIGNFALIDHFFYANTSTDMDAYQQAHLEIGGNPWTNTISASKDGRAWYMDSCPTPNLSQATIDAWLERRESDFIVGNIWSGAGAVALDGSTSRDLWVEEDGALSPGLVPRADLPQLERSDYVFNANDSYWLSHHEETIDGDFSPLHGAANIAQSPRTRMNAVILSESNGLAGDDDKFTLEELGDAAFSNRGMMSELLRAEVVSRCQATPEVSVSFDGSTQMVDLTEACQVLDSWSGVLDPDTVGGHVWREFIGDYEFDDLRQQGNLFSEPFDPADPVGTPFGLQPESNGSDRALAALGRGVLRLQDAGVAINAPLSSIQYTKKNDQQIPIHGGQEREGVPNKIDYGTFQSATSPVMDRGEVINGVTDLSDEGYVINNGTSYVSVVSWDEDQPRVWSLLTYSQTDVTDSENFSDQTELFSGKQWRECLWTDEQIEADPNLRSYEVSGKAQN